METELTRRQRFLLDVSNGLVQFQRDVGKPSDHIVVQFSFVREGLIICPSDNAVVHARPLVFVFGHLPDVPNLRIVGSSQSLVGFPGQDEVRGPVLCFVSQRSVWHDVCCPRSCITGQNVST